MNGMAASDKILTCLICSHRAQGTKTVPESSDLTLRNVSLYDGEKPAWRMSHALTLECPGRRVRLRKSTPCTSDRKTRSALAMFCLEIPASPTFLTRICFKTHIGHQAHLLYMWEAFALTCHSNPEATEQLLARP